MEQPEQGQSRRFIRLLRAVNRWPLAYYTLLMHGADFFFNLHFFEYSVIRTALANRYYDLLVRRQDNGRISEPSRPKGQLQFSAQRMSDASIESAQPIVRASRGLTGGNDIDLYRYSQERT